MYENVEAYPQSAFSGIEDNSFRLLRPIRCTPTAGWPRVSIGICAYNEESTIGPLLSNLLTEQGLPADAEVLVACDGCTDKTEEVTRSFSEKDSRVTMFTQPEREGKARALNRLLNSYTGAVFIHLDADHMPSKGAIRRLLYLLEQADAGAAQACQTPIERNGFMARIGVTFSSLHNHTQQYFTGRAIARHLGGGLFAMKRGVCDQVPEDIVNDDAYIGIACDRKNLRIMFDENAKVHFHSPHTVPELLAQRRRVVFGHLNVQRETGVVPMVLEMCPLKHRLRILNDWLSRNPTVLPYFLACVLLEVYANMRARIDLLRKTDQHKVWVIAKTTKLPPA